MVLESFSDNDDDNDDNESLTSDNKSSVNDMTNCADKLSDLSLNSSSSLDENSAEIRSLLRRKDELERRHRMQEQHNERLQVSTTFFCLFIFIFQKYMKSNLFYHFDCNRILF